jgi:hypothetical protein
MAAVNPKSLNNWSYQVFLSALTALDDNHEIIVMESIRCAAGWILNVPSYLLVMLQDKASQQKAMFLAEACQVGGSPTGKMARIRVQIEATC